MPPHQQPYLATGGAADGGASNTNLNKTLIKALEDPTQWDKYYTTDLKATPTQEPKRRVPVTNSSEKQLAKNKKQLQKLLRHP